MKCRECGQRVSSEAKTCPHCGAGEPAKSKVAGASLPSPPSLGAKVGAWFLTIAGAATVLTTGAGGCKEQKEAKERAADADTTVVSSCSVEAVRDTSISTFSWSDTSDACLAMKRRIYRYPSRSELRFLS